MSLYVLWQIRSLLLLLFTAIVLATVLDRLVCQVRNFFKLPRGLAVLGVLLVLLGTGSILGFILVPPVVEQVQELFQLLPRAFSRAALWVEQIQGPLEEAFGDRPDLLDPMNFLNEITSLLQRSASNLVSFFSNSLTFLLQPLLLLVFTLMLLADPRPYRSGALRLFPSFYRRRADEILDKCALALSSWFAGISLNCVFIGTLSGLGLLVLQVDLVLVHALLAGLLNFIPNIGPAASVVFPLSVALLDNPWKALAVVVLYVVIQNIESYWLTPTVMAARVSLLPAVTLAAQLIFATFFGLGGLILALPLTVVTKVWVEEALFRDILDHWGDRDGPLGDPPEDGGVAHLPPPEETDSETFQEA